MTASRNHHHHHHSLSSITFFTLLILSHPIYSHQNPHPVKDENTPITRFQAYLRFNTAHPNPNYTAPVSFLINQARSIGLQARSLEFTPGKPVLLLTWPGSKPELPSILFNSHLDSVPAEPDKWTHPPFSAVRTPDGKIFARGAQDDKCIGIQYLEAIRNLREVRGFNPIRTVHVSYVPDEEIGGFDGAAKFVQSKEFEDLNVGFVMDEGQASPNDEFRVFYADRAPWHITIRATGIPGHGSRMYDNSAMENLMKSVEMVTKYREAQFDLVKRGWAANSEVVSVNPVYLKAGIPTLNGFAMNMQPSEAEAGFDIRMPPTVDMEIIRKRIAEEWAPASRNMTYQYPIIECKTLTDKSFELINALKRRKINVAVHASKRQNGRERKLKIVEKGVTKDFRGRPLMTCTDDSNPWWSVFQQAITAAGGKLGKPEILASTTDARFMRRRGIPTLGFSPMTNTPILLHDHNEFLQDAIYLRGIKVYESIISSLSSFEGVRETSL